MDDPRTQRVLELAVALITSGNANYGNRTIADVSAELLGNADGIDDALSGCLCSDGESVN